MSAAEQPDGRGRGWKTVPEWTRYTAEELRAFPVGLRLAFVLDGVSVPMRKTGPETWLVESRGGVPAWKLAGRRAARRVMRGGA